MDLGLEKLEAAQARLAAAGDRRPDLDHLLVAMQGFQRAQALVPRIPLEAALRRRSIPAPDASVPLSIPLFQVRPCVVRCKLQGSSNSGHSCASHSLRASRCLRPALQSLHEFVQAGALALGSVGLFYFSGTLARIIGSGLGVGLLAAPCMSSRRVALSAPVARALTRAAAAACLQSYGCVRDSSANLIYLPNSVALGEAPALC